MDQFQSCVHLSKIRLDSPKQNLSSNLTHEKNVIEIEDPIKTSQLNLTSKLIMDKNDHK